MIKSFGDSGTEDLFHRRSTARVRKFPTQVIGRAADKLDVLNAATRLEDLRSPGNNLEALRGELAGYWSIRVNVQWRIVFRWDSVGAHDVRLIDYH